MTKPKDDTDKRKEDPVPDGKTKPVTSTGGKAVNPAEASQRTATATATATTTTTTPTTGRRPPTAKEIIPFQWKLIGESPDAVLTLFKSVERQEVDDHLVRVEREGYYKNLRVLDVDAKVIQPKPPAPPKKSNRQAKKTSKPARSKVTAQPSAKTATKTKRTGKAPSSSSRKAPAKKSGAKTPKTTKSAKKKSASTRSTAKRPTRKKKA